MALKGKILIAGLSTFVPALAVSFTPTSPDDFGFDWLFYYMGASALGALTILVMVLALFSRRPKQIYSLSTLMLTAGAFSIALYAYTLFTINFDAYGYSILITTSLGTFVTLLTQLWLFAGRYSTLREALDHSDPAYEIVE